MTKSLLTLTLLGAMLGLCLKSPKSLLDRVSTGSGSDLVKTMGVKSHQEYRMLITDQVAIAPCTDVMKQRLRA